jgi:hypothetical protein
MKLLRRRTKSGGDGTSMDARPSHPFCRSGTHSERASFFISGTEQQHSVDMKEYTHRIYICIYIYI